MEPTATARETARIEDPEVFAGVGTPERWKRRPAGATFIRVFECHNGDWVEIEQADIVLLSEDGAEAPIGRFPLQMASGLRTIIDRWCKAHPITDRFRER